MPVHRRNSGILYIFLTNTGIVGYGCATRRGNIRTKGDTVLTRREEKLLRSLSQRKIREVQRCFPVEGVRVVEDLLASSLGVRLMVAASTLEDTARGRALLETAERRGVRVCRVPEQELLGYADTQTPQGVIAVAEMPSATLDDLGLAAGRAVVLVLDGVQDPGNFGTLVRTAEALGASAVLALPGTVDPWNPKAVRSAAGSSFRLPLVAAAWSEAEPWLRAHGFGIIAAAMDGEPLGVASERVALVVGNEGSGVSGDTRAVADRVVAIPLRGRAESLNVSAAAAILLFELLR
jgi:RNA methyltransferase, TrmH family